MRIQIIGDNDCARATRHLLRQAGFAVSQAAPSETRSDDEHAPQAAQVSAASASANRPQASYAITIELAAAAADRGSAPSVTSVPASGAQPPESAGVRDARRESREDARNSQQEPRTAEPAEPACAPGPSSHQQLAAGQEEASAVIPLVADASSPASRVDGDFGAEERRREIPPFARNDGARAWPSGYSHPSRKTAKDGAPGAPGPCAANCGADGSPRNDASFNDGGAAIYFDSVESALESAVLRHVTRLWYGPVVVDRPGGRVRSERELRIVVPCAHSGQGKPQQNDAAAAAVELGVLRGMLDLLEAGAERQAGGKEAGGREAGKEAQGQTSQACAEKQPVKKKRTWRSLFGLLMLATALISPRAHGAPKPNPAPIPAPSPTASQIAAWRMAFALPGAALPQGQQPSGAVFDSVYDSGNTALKVNCVVGCGATSGFSDNSAFSVGSTTINPIGAYYSTSTPAISSGNAGRLRMDSNSYLYVDCVTGCSGSGATFGAAFPSSGTAIGGTNGTDLEPLQVNGSGYLETLLENSSIAVTGTFWQTTQPVSWSGQSVSLTGSWPYSGTLGNVGGLGTAGSPSGGVFSVQGVSGGTAVPVSGTFWQTTQPVSGSGVFEVGPTSSANTATNQFFTQLTDGTHAVGNNGSSYSSTYGLNANLLGLDGAVFSATNALFGQITDGTHAMGAMTTYGSAPSGYALPVNAYVTSLPSLIIGTNNAQCTYSTCGTDANLTELDGTALGAPTDFATPPSTSTEVPGVNAAIGDSNGHSMLVDPCSGAAKTYLPVNESTSSTTTIITGTSSKHTYICSIFLIAGTATNVNLLSGTGTNCSTVNAGILGGSTAATGPNLSANGGFTLGNGASSVARDDDAADNVCYAASAGNQVSGVITYVQQ